MSGPFNFRSAFNGFNREDVVHYIEYLNSNHEKQVKQLQADLAILQRERFLPQDADRQEAVIAEMREQFDQQEAVLTALNAEKDELLAKCSQLESALASCTMENKALTEQVAQLEARLTSVPAEKDAGFRPVMSAYVEDELAAYRRAERVERLAIQRAGAIYRQLCAALQDATTKNEQAVTNLDAVSEQLSAQLIALRSSLFDSKAYLDESLGSLKDLFSGDMDDV